MHEGYMQIKLNFSMFEEIYRENKFTRILFFKLKENKMNLIILFSSYYDENTVLNEIPTNSFTTS